MSPGGYASGGSSVCMYIVCMVTMDSVHTLVKNISWNIDIGVVVDMYICIYIYAKYILKNLKI